MFLIRLPLTGLGLSFMLSPGEGRRLLCTFQSYSYPSWGWGAAHVSFCSYECIYLSFYLNDCIILQVIMVVMFWWVIDKSCITKSGLLNSAWSPLMFPCFLRACCKFEWMVCVGCLLRLLPSLSLQRSVAESCGLLTCSDSHPVFTSDLMQSTRSDRFLSRRDRIVVLFYLTSANMFFFRADFRLFKAVLFWVCRQSDDHKNLTVIWFLRGIRSFVMSNQINIPGQSAICMSSW